MTNMNDLEAFEESTELNSRKIKYSWVLLGAVGAFLGVGYVGWALTSPTTAEAASPLQAGLATSPPTAQDELPLSITTESAAQSDRVVDREPRSGALPIGARGEVEEESERVSPPAAAQDETAASSLAEENGVPVEYATNGSFFVQVASYRNKEHADLKAADLSKNHLPAQSVAYGGPAAGWWHAVRLGPFEKRSDAEASRFKLELSERRQAYVLPRSNGKFHVQVASFAEKQKADEVAKGFAVQGHATKISRVTMAGQAWYCVRIGPFETREEALGYQQLVRDIPGGKSEVIPFPPAPQQ